MKCSVGSLSAVAILAAAVSFLCIERPAPADRITPATHAEGTKRLARLPVAFVPNLGQWPHCARYVARIGAMTVFLEEQGWTFTMVERTGEQKQEKENENELVRGAAVRMAFAGAQVAELVAAEQLPGRHHYFLGNDPTKWRSEVPLYRSVHYRDVHPGVDVRAREHDGHFEYDLLLQPGAELGPVEITVEGIDRMHLDQDGALVFDTRLGPVRMPVPLSWEEGPCGEKIPITCRYVVRGNDRFGFEALDRRPDWALVVDPGLVWSTFLGGGNNDVATSLALDAQGAVTVAGFTDSIDLPTTPGAFDTSYSGSIDAFVTRLSPTGSSLVYSTFLGDGGWDVVIALALDAQGAAAVTGFTQSPNFPTTPGAFDRSHGGARDVFVTRLSPLGSALVYSTFLGGTDYELAYGVALGAQGDATIAGYTSSVDFPTTAGAFDTTHNGGLDAFVTRLSPTGSNLVYSTYLGGMDTDEAHALALDAQGVATVAGHTGSADFPTTPGAFDTTHNGSYDAFVARLSPTGLSLVYSTFLGGVNEDGVSALAVDAQGATSVAGETRSADFPTTPGAFDSTYNGAPPSGNDAFVTRFSSTGSTLVYSTFLGGNDADSAKALSLDVQGAATVAGFTQSTDFPTTPGAFDATHNGLGDAFVTRLAPSGSKLVYSTLLGGTHYDLASGLALDTQGAVTVAGSTGSTDFPTTPGAFDTTHHGGNDVFITRLDLLPTGVAAFGRSSPGCTGPLAISVTSMPRVGNGSFALTCGNAPTSASGALVLAASGLTIPIPLLGVEVWLDPSGAFFVAFSARSNSLGASEFALPIPSDLSLIGQRLDAQFYWGGPTSPQPCPPQGLSASNALEITIQP
jgi:hypothetical protein